MKIKNIATKESWENIPITIPKLIKICEIASEKKLIFSEGQYEILKKGLIPEEMEDKWFIYFENNWLYFHRSWTGYGIFKAEIIEEKNNNDDKIYKINEFYVESNKEYYNSDNGENELDLIRQLIYFGLLKFGIRASI